MNNLNGNRKNEFRRKQEEKQRKLALKIKDEAGELREGSLKSEEAIPSLDELCAMGERVEQQTTFSAKEAIRNKIKARRDAERYKTTSTDSEKWTPNPFEDSNAAAIESPKNEDTLNTTRKHADAQSTKSAGLKTSKRRSIVEMVQKLKKYVPIVVCGDVLYYYNGYYYEAIGLEKLIKLYRKYVDYDLNNEPSLYAYKDLYQCCTTDPELERSEPENQSIHAPLENGVYDLMKKELKPHDPRRLIFTYIKASYDESAECPVFYSNGYGGIKVNEAEALKWYYKAAEQGVAEAQFILGLDYKRGEGGVKKDFAKGAEWYRKAAEQGHMYALYNLAVCYEYGEGVPKDKETAIKLYQKAAEQGHTEAEKDVKRLEGGGLGSAVAASAALGGAALLWKILRG